MEKMPYAFGRYIFSLLLFITAFPTQALEKNQQDLNNEALLAIAWHQQAEEFLALSWQTFNIATDLFDEKRTAARPGTKIAIIADIDDTLLNSSACFGGLLERNEAMSPQRSTTWWNAEQCVALPGAKAFLDHVTRHGGTVFYLTNRIEAVKEATMNNLKKAGFPQVKPDQVLLSPTGKESKFPRIRQVIDDGYQVAVILGDKLSDFAINQASRPEDSKTFVDLHQGLFGDLLLVQANAMYGSWESALQGSPLSPDEQAQKRRAALTTFALPEGCSPDDPGASGHIQHLLWKQHSGEFRAITHQLYQRAWIQYQRLSTQVKHPAISVDIDDTLIDNSPFNAGAANQGLAQTMNGFCIWGVNGVAAPIPGSTAFLNKVNMNGGSIFYISNRPNTTPGSNNTNDQRSQVFTLLKQTGYPQIIDKHFLMFEDLCEKPGCDGPTCLAKQTKREVLESGKWSGKPENLILLLGDNLPDIGLLPEHINQPDTPEARKELAKLGRSTFLIPAPNYPPGWIRRMDQRLAAEFANGKKLSPEERHELRLAAIRKWNPER